MPQPRQNVLAPLAALLLATALTGCQPAQKLQRAQDEWNKGATIENTRALEGFHAITLDNARVHYAAALEILKSINHDGALKADGLLGTKIALEGLCQWKLGHYDKVLAYKTAGLKVVDAKSEPRTTAILHALPALATIDQMEAARRAGSIDHDRVRRNLVDGSNSALTQLQTARKVTGKHAVDVFLIQAGLTAWVAYNETRQAAGQPRRPADKADIRKWLQALKGAGQRDDVDQHVVDTLTAAFSQKLGVAP